MIPATALVMSVLILMAAFAVDLGRLRAERRDLQADADAIALDAVQVVGGLGAADALAAALVEANASALRNDWPTPLTAADVEVGVWDVATQTFTPLAGAGPVDAVRVRLSSSIPMYFDLSADDRSVRREAVAVALAQAKAEIGSVLTGIEVYDPTDGCAARASADAQMTFMNHLYTEYFGIDAAGGVGAAADSGTVSCDVTGPTDGLQLDALSWKGLAAGTVDMADVAARMGFGSPDELLASEVGAGDLLQASADSMAASGDPSDVAAATVLGSFASSIDGGASIDMAGIASGGLGNVGSVADLDLNALDLVSMSAMAIDGNGFLSVDLPTALPLVGVAVPVRIGIIEPPRTDWRYKFASEAGPRTAQVKIGIEVPITGAVLDFAGLGGVLAALGAKTTTGTLAIVVEVARAESVHDEISCDLGGPETAADALTVETAGVTVSLGTTTDAELQQSGDATVAAEAVLNGTFGVEIPLLGSVGINLDTTTAVTETVTYGAEGAFTGGHEATVGLLGATETHQFSGPFPSDYHRYQGGVSTLTATDATFGSADFTLTAGLLSTLGTTSAAFDDLVSGAVAPLTAEVDNLLIDPLLRSLGLTLAGADARIVDIRCQAAALANRG